MDNNLDMKNLNVQHHEDILEEQAEGKSKSDQVDREELAGLEGDMIAAVKEENAYVFRRSFLKLYAFCFVAYLCSATNGFDSNTFGGVTALPRFTNHYDINVHNQGLVSAIYIIGNIAGSFTAGPISDNFGRKAGMAIGSVIAIVGSIIQVAGHRIGTLMGGRFILGFGAVIVQTAGPSYVVEMAYPKYRAELTGGYQTCFFLGTIVSTWLEFGLGYIDSSVNWRLPVAVQALPSVIVLCFIFFIPESCRWYVAHGKVDKAREILLKYHADGKESSKLVDLELAEMKALISVNGSDKRFWDIRELFNSKSSRYQIFLVICVAWFGQLTLPPTSYYFPIMAEALGYTNKHTQQLLNAIQTPIMMVAALSGLRFISVFGRRKLLMISSTGMAICFSTTTACYAHHDGNPHASATGLAFIYIFLAVFAFAWTPCQSLYPVEVLSYNIRAKGLAFLNLMVNCAQVLNTYVPPEAINAVGWRYYLFYVLWDFTGAVVVFLFFVETKGRTLEEIAPLFQKKHPVRESLKLQKQK